MEGISGALNKDRLPAPAGSQGTLMGRNKKAADWTRRKYMF
jgi:hypothetical protein